MLNIHKHIKQTNTLSGHSGEFFDVSESVKRRGTFGPRNAIKTYRGNGCLAPLICNLGTIWR